MRDPVARGTSGHVVARGNGMRAIGHGRGQVTGTRPVHEAGDALTLSAIELDWPHRHGGAIHLQ